jgi:hypothetical protein
MMLLVVLVYMLLLFPPLPPFVGQCNHVKGANDGDDDIEDDEAKLDLRETNAHCWHTLSTTGSGMSLYDGVLHF